MSRPLFKIDNTDLNTREDLVSSAIRAAILRGTFKPGDKLDQQQIADELNVSRSPVREALRTLGAEGLVTIIPNRGAIVTERSLQELEELYKIRVILEGAAAERAAPHMTSKLHGQLKMILDQAEDTDDFEELLELNNDFHMAVYSAYDQPIMMSYIQQLRNMVAPYNRLYMDQLGGREEAWADHRRIYEACLRKDGDGAKSETVRHLERVFISIMETIRNTVDS